MLCGSRWWGPLSINEAELFMISLVTKVTVLLYSIGPVSAAAPVMSSEPCMLMLGINVSP